MRAFKNICFALILAGMSLPLVQQKYHLFDVKPLSGAYNLPDTVNFSFKNWISGEFQEKYGPFYEYQIGLRPFFVRLRNQLYYWVFHQSTTYVVVGKQDQLYAWNYWAPFRGMDYVGKDSVLAHVRSIRQLQDQLKQHNIPLLVVIGANKARYMPEYLPDDYVKTEQLPSNYREYLHALDTAGIRYIDFNAIFLSMKAQFGDKMFPNTGTHWAAYGMGMCLDSIVSFADRYAGDSIKDIRLTSYVVADSVVDSDLDISNDMNLMWPVSRKPNLFPVFNTGSAGRKARIFTIGDSFYWNLYQLDAFYEVVDSSSHYWYYNNTEIDFNGGRTPVSGLNAEEIVTRCDVVVLLATEANLHLFPYGFPREYLKR